jgi:hypothetical protein
VTRPLPRFVRVIYWDLTGYYRRLGCSISSEPLGADYTAASVRMVMVVVRPNSPRYSMNGDESDTIPVSPIEGLL